MDQYPCLQVWTQNLVLTWNFITWLTSGILRISVRLSAICSLPRVKPLNYACNDIDLNWNYAYLLIGMLHPILAWLFCNLQQACGFACSIPPFFFKLIPSYLIFPGKEVGSRLTPPPHVWWGFVTIQLTASNTAEQRYLKHVGTTRNEFMDSATGLSKDQEGKDRRRQLLCYVSLIRACNKVL